MDDSDGLLDLSVHGLKPYSMIDRTILPQSDWLNGILSSMKSKSESGRSVIILWKWGKETNLNSTPETIAESFREL